MQESEAGRASESIVLICALPDSNFWLVVCVGMLKYHDFDTLEDSSVKENSAWFLCFSAEEHA